MNRIKELRKKRGLTQGELGDELHVTQGMISAYEKDKYQIPNDMLKKLAAYFGVSIDYVLGNDTKQATAWSPADYSEHGVAVRTQPRLSDLSETDLDILARKLENRIGSGQGNYTPAEQDLVDDFRQLSPTQKSRIRAMIAGYLDARYDNE